MSNYQQMIEDLVEAYELRLSTSPDEQEWVHDEVLRRIKGNVLGVKFNDVSIFFSSTLIKAAGMEKEVRAYADSPAVEEYLTGIQYDLMRHCVILERALAVAAAANQSYEHLSTGEWVS